MEQLQEGEEVTGKKPEGYYEKTYSMLTEGVAIINSINAGQTDYPPDFDVEEHKQYILSTLSFTVQKENWPEEFDLTPINEVIAANQN